MAITVLYFWADWCGPCKTLGPLLTKICEEQKIELTKIDAEEDSKNLVKEYGVQSLPTFVILKDGKESKRQVGLIPRAKIEGLLRDCV